MNAVVLALHSLSAFVILIEALNKAERTDPFQPALAPRQRAAEWLKAAAWALLSLGAAGALVAPLLHGTQPPGVADLCIAAGFAVLIVKTRVKEG